MIKEYHLHLDDDDCLTDYCATQIEINPVLAMLLKRSEIEEELLKTLLECSSIDCSLVIDEYEDWFIEKFKKEAKE